MHKFFIKIPRRKSLKIKLHVYKIIVNAFSMQKFFIEIPRRKSLKIKLHVYKIIVNARIFERRPCHLHMEKLNVESGSMVMSLPLCVFFLA